MPPRATSTRRCRAAPETESPRPGRLHQLIHQTRLIPAPARCTVLVVEQTISSASLRRQAGACLARVSRGDTLVVLRHGHPVAVLRPPRSRETRRSRAATFLWRNFGDVMAAARRDPVLITWYGDGMAVLEPVPAGWEREP